MCLLMEFIAHQTANKPGKLQIPRGSIVLWGEVKRVKNTFWHLLIRQPVAQNKWSGAGEVERGLRITIGLLSSPTENESLRQCI